MGIFWAGLLERYHNLLLPLHNHNELTAGLLFPEAKLALSQLLAATGVVGACMDASDGPTQAIRSLAASSECDFIVDLDLLQPNESVSLVARYIDVDPRVLMFTWGNFELVFTAREDTLYKSLGKNLTDYKVRKIGNVRTGPGRALLGRKGKKSTLPQLATEQFSGSTRASIPGYEQLLRETRFEL